MAQVNVTIIGLERLGASFGLALKALSSKPEAANQFIITGSDQRVSALKEALKIKAIDADVRDPALAVENADIVIITARYAEAEELFSVIGPSLKSGTVVMDTAPLKLPSVAWAKKHFRKGEAGQQEAYLVGALPIVNPEYLGDVEGGAESARVDLLDGGLMVLSPAADCPSDAIKLIADLSSLMGLKVHFTEPAEHDGMIAGMEGLPVLLQLGLFRSLSKAATWRDTQWLANPAFAQMTYRLVLETSEDMAALLHRNRENTLGKLDALIEDLREIRELLAIGDEIEVAEAFQDAANRYDRWRINRIKGVWETDAERQATETLSPRGYSLMGGALGNLFSRGKKSKESKSR